jgi:hypothetical protein
VTSLPVVSFTLAILRNAELGFLGVFVVTLVQVPLFAGQTIKAGELLL